MGEWDTTYAPAMSPFSYSAGTDQLAGLSPFGKQMGQGLFKGMSGMGAGLMGQQPGGMGGSNPFQMGLMGLGSGFASGGKDGGNPLAGLLGNTVKSAFTPIWKQDGSAGILGLLGLVGGSEDEKKKQALLNGGAA